MKRCAVIGGGPGGLLTAYFLEEKLGSRCHVVLFEAEARVGGKIRTDSFRSVPASYEAGVAELYGYSQIGPDPLQELIRKLGLAIIPMEGQAVFLSDRIVASRVDLRRLFGDSAYNAVDRFHEACQEALSPEEYYEGHWQDDNESALSGQSFAEYLSQVPDETALRYIKTSVHSDTATEPHLTNALNGIKNSLMDDPRYLSLYTIQGGIEEFPRALEKRISGEIKTSRTVTRVERTGDGRYQVSFSQAGEMDSQSFDTVILALPDYWLRSIEFADSALQHE